jgi:xanthine dehydrogenase YagS FAD-binding subunit
VSLLSEYREEAKIIAGGTDVIGLMRNRVISPKALVDIKTLPELAYIKEEAEGLKIGALTTIKDVETSAIIRSKYNILADAARSVAAPQIRNMGTISGNLCQDVRCWYYRRSPVTGNSFFCYRKGGRLCDAAAGQNASHAIIGSGKCRAVSPSDMAPALIALRAKVKIVGSTGERVISLEELYTALGNILEPDELITEIQTPTPKVGTRQRYLKFRQRKAIDFAISSVAAVITTKEEIVSKARIILGGVSPTPYRAVKAEVVLQGETMSERMVETAVSAALEMAKPLAMNAHKIPITEALLRRALVG